MERRGAPKLFRQNGKEIRFSPICDAKKAPKRAMSMREERGKKVQKFRTPAKVLAGQLFKGAEVRGSRSDWLIWRIMKRLLLRPSPRVKKSECESTLAVLKLEFIATERKLGLCYNASRLLRARRLLRDFFSIHSSIYQERITSCSLGFANLDRRSKHN